MYSGNIQTQIEVSSCQGDWSAHMHDVVVLCMYSVYVSFTMEAIFSTTFGQEIEIQKGQSNQLAKAAGKVFGRDQDSKLVSPLFWMILLSKGVCVCVHSGLIVIFMKMLNSQLSLAPTIFGFHVQRQ